MRKKHVVKVILAGIIIFITGLIYGKNATSKLDDNSLNGPLVPPKNYTCYHLYVYNDSDCKWALHLTGRGADWPDKNCGYRPYIRMENKVYKDFLQELPPGKYAEVTWYESRLARKTNAFNLKSVPWMGDYTPPSWITQRIFMNKGAKPPYLNNGDVMLNREQGYIVISPVVFTDKRTWTMDTFYESIVRKLGLDTNKPGGKIVKAAVKIGMKAVFAKCSFQTTHYYYETSIKTKVPLSEQECNKFNIVYDSFADLRSKNFSTPPPMGK